MAGWVKEDPVARADDRLYHVACPDDAQAVAQLHADSWRRHYRGAYSDAFLDGDVVIDRVAVWTSRLRKPDPRRCTIVAKDPAGDGRLLGFASTFFDADPRWGALLDNLQVAGGCERRGIGSRLLALTAQALIERPQETGLYLWVLEQNVVAQAFYEASGGRCVEFGLVPPPGGIAGRLAGAPTTRRYAWPKPAVLLGPS
jgi:ribosomal protein S18 acetylase RimI-like enzyme